MEHELGVRRGAIDDGEGVAGERGTHGTGFVTREVRGLEDDGGRRGVEATEEFEDATAAVVAGGVVGVVAVRGGVRTGGQARRHCGSWRRRIEGDAEVDDGDMNLRGANDALGLTCGAGADAGDAERLEHGGEDIDPA